MFKYRASVLFAVFAFLAAAFSLVNALAPPVPAKRDLVILADICAELNVGVDVILTSLAKCAAAKEDPTSLLVELVAELNLCAAAIVKIDPSKWDKTLFITLCVNLIINIQACLSLFLYNLTALLSILLSVKLDVCISALLAACNKVYANVCVAIGIKLSLAIVAVLIELKLLLTVKILGLGLLGL